MKKQLYVLVTFLLVSSCNMFDIIDPDINHLDKCMMLADRGKFDDAIESCNKADPNGLDPVAQVELGDLYLARAGITLSSLSAVFFNASQGADIIVSLAESIIATGGPVTEDRLNDASSSITAFDLAGSYFYSVLARLCYITMALAITDSDGLGSADTEGNGTIEPEDVCSASACDTFCFESITPCQGMSAEVADTTATHLASVSSFLAELGLGSLDNAIDEMLNTEIPDPADPLNSTKTFSELGASPGDAVRMLFKTMVAQ